MCHVKLSRKRPDFEKLSRRASAGPQTLYSPLVIFQHQKCIKSFSFLNITKRQQVLSFSLDKIDSNSVGLAVIKENE